MGEGVYKLYSDASYKYYKKPKRKMREGHIPVPWWAYLAVGGLITGYDLFLQSKVSSDSSMTLFFYLGLIFIIIGLGKIAFGKFAKKTNNDDKKTQQHYAKQLSQQQRAWQHEQQRQASHPGQHNVHHCPRCGTQSQQGNNLCHKCGARLR
ncbi:zinc ribbon domain-containing protein [Candidatus Woesearchaeota archaeon]|nr:zinc ribbon domain-containing protein [Candidatus Woesearchaeota archaeon]